VLDIREAFDARRVRYRLKASSSWALVSLEEPECLQSPEGCFSVNAGATLPSALALRFGPGERRWTYETQWPRSWAEATTKWLLGTKIGDASALAALLRGQPSMAAQASTNEDDLWTAVVRGSVTRHLLVARTSRDDCDLELTRETIDCSKYDEALPNHASSSWVLPTQRGPDGTPSIDPANALIERLASRTARIHYRTNDGGYGVCTGFLLSSTVVLTAKHCVEPTDDLPETPQCLLQRENCSSYVVDVDFRRDARPAYSLAVRHATSRGNLDFALLHLEKSALLQPEPLMFAPTSSTECSGQLLLAHPRGIPLHRAGCGVEDETAGDHAFHRCYAQKGSSGGLLLRGDRSVLSPITLHTNAFNECGGAMANEKLLNLYGREAGRLRILSEPCVGMGIKIMKIYEQMCGDPANPMTDCALFHGSSKPERAAAPAAVQP
jgi:hypothetical protein